MKKLLFFASLLVAGMLAFTSCGNDKKDEIDFSKFIGHKWICDSDESQFPARLYVFFKNENDYERGAEYFSDPERKPEQLFRREYWEGSFDFTKDNISFVENYYTIEENGEVVRRDTLEIAPLDVHYTFVDDTLSLTYNKGEENEKNYKFWLPKE